MKFPGSLTRRLAILAVLTIPIIVFAAVGKPFASGASGASSGPRAPSEIATTLAYFNGQVVTVQYSNIYFCNSAGPATSSTTSPCKVGVDAAVDPVPDVASNTLNVIVPAFLHPLCDLLKIPCQSGSVFDPTLGANNFAQCPDNTATLTCPNHPMFLDLSPTGIAGVVPLPIHSHVLSGTQASSQGGWWKLTVWLVTDPSVWPNPSNGACVAGTGCVTTIESLQAAQGAGKAVGPVKTTIYLFFNRVSPNAH